MRTNEETSKHYLSASQVAAICDKFIERKLKFGKDHVIKVVPRMLLANQCDSFALSMIDDDELEKFIDDTGLATLLPPSQFK